MGHEVEQQHWRCYAYCLLGNDSHFLLETPEGHLSSEMRRLNGTYMQAFNRRHQRGGHVLQGRFASILVEKDASLLELCRYIVLNPVRAKMVRTVQAWSWSSYRATVGRASIPPWLAVTTVHRLFHRTKIGAQQRYQQFVREGMKEPSPWAQVRGEIFLGNEVFLASMAKLVKKQSLTNVPKAQTQPTRLTGEEVLAWVGQVYSLHSHEVLTRVYPVSLCRLAVAAYRERTARGRGSAFWSVPVSNL
ncbi:MAG: hypothetical protein O7F12_08435, partial [Nitrospirae bacterium]|nr:hypothetical protein [Nitrospirota bacterium]